MKRKMLLPIICLALGLVAAASSVIAPIFRPVVIGGDDPGLNQLRTTNRELQPFTAMRVKATEDRLAEHRRQTWNEKQINLWAESNVRSVPGWVFNDLGTTDYKHVHGHRYAMQRINATNGDWPLIARLLQTVESLPCASVESVTLTVGDGVSGSQHFKQCVFVVVFYLNGDDA
jgi:hypothetical protein